MAVVKYNCDVSSLRWTVKNDSSFQKAYVFDLGWTVRNDRKTLLLVKVKTWENIVKLVKTTNKNEVYCGRMSLSPSFW